MKILILNASPRPRGVTGTRKKEYERTACENLPSFGRILGSDGGTMKTISISRSRGFRSLLLVMVLAGCTTNITPPSGPAGTEVCFDPAPPRSQWVGGACGWYIDLKLDEATVSTDYTYEQCFTIPSQLSPGDELLVEVTGDWSGAWFGCEEYKYEVPGLLPLYEYFGAFLVTE